MDTSEGEKVVLGDSSGTTITGLEPGTMYQYQVAAQTMIGTGVYSNIMTTITSGILRYKIK